MLNFYFFHLMTVLGIIPVLILKKYKITSQKAITPFLWLAFAASIEEFIVYYIVKYPEYNSLPGYTIRLYALFEFLAIYYYYREILRPKYQFFLRGYLIIFALLYLYLLSIWDIRECFTTDSYLIVCDTIFVLMGAFLWLKNIVYTIENNLLTSPDLYYVFGFVFYFSSTVTLFLLADYIFYKDHEEFSDYYNLNLLSNVIWRSLLIIGVWKARKN